MVDAVTRLHRTGATLTVVAMAFLLVVSSVVPLRAWAQTPTDAMRDFFGAVNLALTDPRTADRPVEKLSKPPSLVAPATPRRGSIGAGARGLDRGRGRARS